MELTNRFIQLYLQDHSFPDYIIPFLSTQEMERLKGIGMNCGCEYTSFERFRNIGFYSRYEHSLQCALIVHYFTQDPKQVLAALFHDIASPTFAHSIDFFNGDYMNQESTEKDTRSILENSKEITNLLQELHLTIDDVDDYHLYPIADNDSPKLSSDRLEYTLGNLVRYQLATIDTIEQYCKDLVVGINEEGQVEICFKTLEIALAFARGALECSRIYVCDEDRYAMDHLASILKKAVELEVIDHIDLMTTESVLIDQLLSNTYTKELWEEYRSFDTICYDQTNKSRVIFAKKRRIDPYIIDQGRLSALVPFFKEELEEFINEKQDYCIYATNSNKESRG